MIATLNNNDSIISLFSALFEELGDGQQQENSIGFGDQFFTFNSRTSKLFEPIPLECMSSCSVKKSFHHNNTIQKSEDAFFQKIQATTQQSTVVLKDTDVICGRSKSAFHHIGNRRFRVTISIFLRRYLETPSRLDRSMLIYEIIDTVLESGSRFLKEESNGEWVELSQKERRNKVGHALRDAAAAYHRNNRK